MEAGLVDQACVKFEQSMATDPAIGTLLNIATCHEKAGRKTQACNAFRQAAQMSKGSSDARTRFATERADGLGCPP